MQGNKGKKKFIIGIGYKHKHDFPKQLNYLCDSWFTFSPDTLLIIFMRGYRLVK